MQVVEETPVAGSGAPLHVHPGWAERFPWLVQGTTGRALGDLGLFGSGAVGAAMERWRVLRQAAGCARAVHARQVHGARILEHGPGGPGLLVSDGFDGHATREVALLLTVSVADCVPIFVVDAGSRAVALLHGGWRGVAGGILEAGVAALQRIAGSRPASLWVHSGPAICGECYEVGPEVHQALGLDVPTGPVPVDLRGVIADRARSLGVPDAHVSISPHCTRCSGGLFFSHRGGSAERQMAVLAVRAPVE